MPLVLAMIILPGCDNRKATKFTILPSDVPGIISLGFQQRYPSGLVREWEVEKEGEHLVFEVGFTYNSKPVEAAFNPDGTFLREE